MIKLWYACVLELSTMIDCDRVTSYWQISNSSNDEFSIYKTVNPQKWNLLNSSFWHHLAHLDIIDASQSSFNCQPWKVQVVSLKEDNIVDCHEGWIDWLFFKSSNALTKMARQTVWLAWWCAADSNPHACKTKSTNESKAKVHFDFMVTREDMKFRHK